MKYAPLRPAPLLGLAFALALPAVLPNAALGALPAASAELLRKADRLYLERETEASAREALRIYQELRAATREGEPEILWRAAMASYFVGLRFSRDDDTRIRIHADGARAAQRAIALDPDCAACHFWAAINLALLGQARGIVNSLFSLPEIRERLHVSALLDPKYASSGAYRLLGLIELKLPGLLGGDRAQARKYLELAIEESPSEPLNYLVLSRILEESKESRERVLAVVRRGLAQAPRAPEQLESREALKELHERERALAGPVSGGVGGAATGARVP